MSKVLPLITVASIRGTRNPGTSGRDPAVAWKCPVTALVDWRLSPQTVRHDRSRTCHDRQMECCEVGDDDLVQRQADIVYFSTLWYKSTL
jgi:hypothetical protein